MGYYRVLISFREVFAECLKIRKSETQSGRREVFHSHVLRLEYSASLSVGGPIALDGSHMMDKYFHWGTSYHTMGSEQALELENDSSTVSLQDD